MRGSKEIAKLGKDEIKDGCFGPYEDTQRYEGRKRGHLT